MLNRKENFNNLQDFFVRHFTTAQRPADDDMTALHWQLEG